MNKAELIEQISKDAGISKKDADVALKSLLNNIIQAIKKKGGRFTMLGFGSFSTLRRKARKGRNPRTGESIKIKASKVIKFKASKKLNEAV